MEENEIPCREAHMVKGIIPQLLDVQFANLTCDCGKILYVEEECGCVNNRHMEIRAKENPNYAG